MKNSTPNWWRAKIFAEQILSLRKKYPKKAAKINGLIRSSSLRNMLSSREKIQANEKRRDEQTEKDWSKWTKKNKLRIKDTLFAAKIFKTRLRREDPEIYKDIFK